MKVVAIVAVDINLAIGYNNELLFKSKQDMKHFKDTTTGHTVIMGRKTFESIGRALPNRTNIVLSKDKEFIKRFNKKSLLVTDSEPRALLKTIKESDPNTTVFIIGGAQIYELFKEFTDEVILTKLEHEFELADSHYQIPYGFEFKKIKDFLPEDAFLGKSCSVYKGSKTNVC